MLARIPMIEGLDANGKVFRDIIILGKIIVI
jgi:hypothetical protein